MTDDEDDNNKVLVGVRITPEKRDEWKEFVDESDEYSSMADMMRTGVSRIMKGDDGAADIEDDVEKFYARMGEVMRQIRDLKQGIDNVEEQIPDVDEIADETSYKIDNLPEERKMSRILEELNRGGDSDE